MEKQITADQSHLLPAELHKALNSGPHNLVKNKTQRNEALDFTKGSLVLFMVLYHWIAYFVVLSWDAYRYLRFLTPSFILITGFLVSNVYLAKHSYGDPRLHRKLLKRGFKLLLLFTFLNLAASFALTGNDSAGPTGVGSFVADSFRIYVSGSGRAIFDVLVPISYFLLLSPLVLIASKTVRLPLYVAGIAAVVGAMCANLLGVKSANLELLSIGILGLGVGSIPISRINALVRYRWLFSVAYIFYLLAITRWNIVFPLQVAGVLLSLLLLYILGVKAGSEGTFQRIVIELGKYSLFAYIAHILMLQLLRRGLRRFDFSGTESLIPFTVTLVLTVLIVVFVSVARQKSNTVDRLYRVVFA